jgi:hypothetical protein
MKSIKTARQELNTLRNDVIGIFQNRHGGVFEMIVNNQDVNSSIDTIYISSFGVICVNYNTPKSLGTVKLFPNNKNMNEMLNDPFEWDAFMKQF